MSLYYRWVKHNKPFCFFLFTNKFVKAIIQKSSCFPALWPVGSCQVFTKSTWSVIYFPSLSDIPSSYSLAPHCLVFFL